MIGAGGEHGNVPLYPTLKAMLKAELVVWPKRVELIAQLSDGRLLFYGNGVIEETIGDYPLTERTHVIEWLSKEEFLEEINDGRTGM